MARVPYRDPTTLKELARLSKRTAAQHAKTVPFLVHLTPKQQAFVSAYVTHFDGARAAREAGVSDKSAKEKAVVFLANEKVQTAIRETLVRHQNDRIATRDQVLAEATKIGLSDVRELLEPDNETPTMRPPNQWPDGIAGAISSVEFEEEIRDKDGQIVKPGKVKAKLWSKTEALTLLAKYHKIVGETVEHTGNISLSRGPDLSGETTEELKARLTRLLAELSGEGEGSGAAG